MFPVRLALAGIDLDEALAGGAAAGAAVKAVKEQLPAVPDNGIGYGLLRYLNDDTAAVLAAAGAPQVGFNYLGRASAAGAQRMLETRDWLPTDVLGPLAVPAEADMAAAAVRRCQRHRRRRCGRGRCCGRSSGSPPGCSTRPR